MTANEKPGGNRAGGIGGRPSRLQYSTRTRAGGIPIYVGSKTVGAVKGDCFFKRVMASAHFLRKPPAIAFDVSTLRDAEAAGAKWVEVTDAESGRVYRASMATVWERGKGFNRGYGAQWFLPLNEWNRPQAPTQGRLFQEGG